ncbi:unnamed protein product, partial [Polarella glacialis]
LLTRRGASELRATCREHLSELDMLNSLTALHRIAKLSHTSVGETFDGLVLSLVDRVIAMITCPELTGAIGLANAAWASAKAGARGKARIGAIASRSTTSVSGSSCQDPSNMVRTSGGLLFRGQLPCDAISDPFAKKTAERDPQDPGNSARRLAKLGLENQPVLSDASLQATKVPTEPGPQNSANA